jgi:hypothetical protein
VSTQKSKKYDSFEKERNFFSSLFSSSSSSSKVFVVFCPLRVRWLLTCPFLEQKRVHTYWTVEHSCDISLSLFPIIYYLVAKDTILYLLSLFDERREQKKHSRRMVFVVERNEEVVLLRARAPESIRVYWKK